jgi:alpha-D-ribose 1-methylphosphonate 5-triphosphate synthase subunit PhnG
MSIDTAIRNCVTTSISQVASKATFQFMREANINLVLVSAHIGARFTPFIEPANHQSWQGQIYEVAQEDLKKM